MNIGVKMPEEPKKDLRTVKVTINFPIGQIKNLLISALEGGSNYWYQLDREEVRRINEYGKASMSFIDRLYVFLEGGNSIMIDDIEDDEELGQLSMKSIRKALRLMAKNSPHHFADAISEKDDATTADVFFQYAVMGEVKFG